MAWEVNKYDSESDSENVSLKDFPILNCLDHLKLDFLD